MRLLRSSQQILDTFFCAGNLAETLGIHHVREMDSLGHRMPWTMGAFTVAALGVIGVLAVRSLLSTAYGVIVQAGSAPTLRAGKVCVVMALLGEALLICELLLATAAAGGMDLRQRPAVVAASPLRNLIIALVLAGFGVKAGALPLHMCLPQAHLVAPAPVSAVLSGGMIKTGVLGWVRFPPLGTALLMGRLLFRVWMRGKTE